MYVIPVYFVGTQHEGLQGDEEQLIEEQSAGKTVLFCLVKMGCALAPALVFCCGLEI